MLSSAMHTSPEAFERPRCHEKTRVAILQHLRDWVNGVVQLYAKMLWLYGDAGAGKSTIAQTLAEQLNGKQLIASFFFSRNEGSRASHISLVATIVYQAALAIPGLRILVDEAVMLNPQIFDQNLAAQLTHLLVEPLNTLLEAPGPSFDTLPSLIIIDGLDECSNPQMPQRSSNTLHRLITTPLIDSGLYRAWSRASLIGIFPSQTSMFCIATCFRRYLKKTWTWCLKSSAYQPASPFTAKRTWGILSELQTNSETPTSFAAFSISEMVTLNVMLGLLHRSFTSTNTASHPEIVQEYRSKSAILPSQTFWGTSGDRCSSVLVLKVR